MNQEFCNDYAALDRDHWWWKARRDLLKEELTRLAGGRTDLTLLDVGCGDGYFFDELAAFGEVQGIEPDTRMLTPDGRHRDRIHVGAFDEHFQPEAQFDWILMLDVLEHMDNRSAALSRARELLAPGGKLILSVPAFPLLWTKHDVACEHRLRYTRQSLREAIRDEELFVERTRFFFHWMFPAKLAVRMLEAVLPSKPRSPRLLPAGLNNLLYRVCRMEESMVGGLGLPLGSSLFMVCRPSPTV